MDRRLYSILVIIIAFKWNLNAEHLFVITPHIQTFYIIATHILTTLQQNDCVISINIHLFKSLSQWTKNVCRDYYLTCELDLLLFIKTWHMPPKEKSHWPRQWEFLSTKQHVIAIRRISYLPVHSNRFLYMDLQQSVWNLCMSAKIKREECVKLNYFLLILQNVIKQLEVKTCFD